MKTIANIIHQNKFPLEIVSISERMTYYENSYGYWEKVEYDEDGEENYYADSKGYANIMKIQWDITGQ